MEPRIKSVPKLVCGCEEPLEVTETTVAPTATTVTTTVYYVCAVCDEKYFFETSAPVRPDMFVTC